MKRVLLVCPSEWDSAQLPRAQRRWRGKYTVLHYGDNAERSPATFDALSFIQETVRSFRSAGLDGVTSSSDYPGCIVAAIIARELGLPGPDPLSVLRCSHKYYSRIAQSAAVPEATPGFALIDPDNFDEQAWALPFPLFVKPVKSWFTQHARRVDTFDELLRYVRSASVRLHLSAFVAPFNQLVARYTDFAYDGRYMLAEELLEGQQVTLEGFVFRGRAKVVGIVDSVMFPGTISFERFEYPSSLSVKVRARMSAIASRVMRHVGFDNGVFNIELFYNNETDQVHIIEINPRMCGQFADLMEMVNGTNTYEILLALAAGDHPPRVKRGSRFQAAASFALRRFEDAKVLRVPDDSRVASLKALYPVSLVTTFVREQRLLSEDEYESDGYSYRYGVINLGGRDRVSLLSEFQEVHQRLGFELEDVD